jgi:hypothetical protein
VERFLADLESADGATAAAAPTQDGGS